MLEKILVPDIGDYSNVEIIGVAIKVGDSINKEDEMLTLETDKATMELPAPLAGVVKELLVKVGDKVSKGSPLLMLETTAAQPAVAVVQSEKAATTEAAQTKSQPAIQDIILPDIGSDKPAAIIELTIKPGDVIAIDDTLMTLESDKASMDVPSPKAGTVQEVLVKVGDKVKTGTKIATILATTNTSTVVPPPVTIDRREQPQDRRVGEPDLRTPPAERRSGADRRSNLPYAGPGVRRFARELGVDLHKVVGNGRKNRILYQDIKTYVKQTLTSGGAQSGGLNVSPATEIDFSKFGKIEVQALSRIQKISGTFLHRNWVTIPHVTQFDEADITELELFRKGQKEIAEKQGVKITPVVFLMKAIVAGLKQFPKFNSSLDAKGEELILKKYFHIGVAVDTPNGLMVPVIRDVDQKGLFELAADLGTVGKKAREGKLSAADMQGGCFTISSLGGIGGTAFTPIINAPEVAILGVSKSQIKPIYVENSKTGNQFEPRLMLPLSLSYDHRVIDGADAVRFSSFLVGLLADIRRLLL
jgi:pyruvate dehydrogenase E2 component (dihydrolipoamide acetyltransferase)